MNLLDCGKAVNVACLGFNKDFEKAPREGLGGKLEDFGLDFRIVRWIGNWLENHTQMSKDISSDGREFFSGVLGSGPVLLKIF